jgi:hypothetical protein
VVSTAVLKVDPVLDFPSASWCPDISWNEKGELKYKGETVQGSNVVDLVNDVLRKRKYFNPQGWETFGEALREARTGPVSRVPMRLPRVWVCYRRRRLNIE